jgi:1-acyl-sn-glycerol-3-phosphate acyltransferase
MLLFKRNIFGLPYFFKFILISVLGSLTFPRFSIYNKSRIKGTEYLRKLPSNNVLFVSNHQTYFADVMLMYHVFSSTKWGFKNRVNNPIYLLSPKIDTYFVAADETMKSGILPKLFSWAGSISVKRTWRAAGEEIQREVDPKDTENISKALKDGWVITFPQGTTKPFMKGRKGTARIIKEHKPIVIPVVINGFRRAFDKKGLVLKKTGVELQMVFKEPMDINFDDEPEHILEQIMDAIGQSEKYNLFKNEDEELNTNS